MSSSIDATARVAPGARLGSRVEIGPFCVVGADAVIGDDCRLLASVHVAGHTRIGPRTVVHPCAVLGGPPQSVSYRGEPTSLVIGADCTIRESVTMHVGTTQGGGVTTVGDRGYFMVGSHVAHDCRVGDNVQFANGATLGGHCEVGDNVVLSGYVAVHQFVRIGIGAMVSGGTMISSDVVPFAMVAGSPARVIGINSVGMRRRAYANASILAVRMAFRELFSGSGPFEQRIEEVAARLGGEPAVGHIVAFLRARGRRSVYHTGRRRAEQVTDHDDVDA